MLGWRPQLSRACIITRVLANLWVQRSSIVLLHLQTSCMQLQVRRVLAHGLWLFVQCAHVSSRALAYFMLLLTRQVKLDSSTCPCTWPCAWFAGVC